VRKLKYPDNFKNNDLNMNHNTLINNNTELNISSIVSHRINGDNYEFLFEITSDSELEFGDEEVYVENKTYTEYSTQYLIWIKDLFSFNDFCSSLRIENAVGFNKTDRDFIIIHIHRYCCRKDIKILFCFVHKLQPSTDLSNFIGEEIQKICDENYEQQLRCVKFFKKLYPGHKVVISDHYTEQMICRFKDHFLSSALRIAKIGDVIYSFNYKGQIVRENDIIFFTRRIKNIHTNRRDIETINLYTKILNIEELISRTKCYVSIFDYNFCLKKDAIETVILTTNNRIAQNSSLKVLPKHLLREILRWL
jgi:hypothetical protein